MFGSKKITTIAATALVLGMGFSAGSFAGNGHGQDKDKSLPPIDDFVKTIFDKSIIAGNITGVDSTGKYTFDYNGDVFSVKTDDDSGTLTGLDEKLGTIEGQAAFPQAFVDMATGMKAYLATCTPTGCTGDMPAIPPSMDWTCNKCKMVIGDNVYVSIVDAAKDPNFAHMLNTNFPNDGADGFVEATRMEGRAFTGLGPVEIGGILNGSAGMSMSVRMAGCSAVVAVAGPDGPQFDDGGNMIDPPMMGTLCLNGTFTFDLNSPSVAGTGSSNCVTVLHRPIM